MKMCMYTFTADERTNLNMCVAMPTLPLELLLAAEGGFENHSAGPAVLGVMALHAPCWSVVAQFMTFETG